MELKYAVVLVLVSIFLTVSAVDKTFNAQGVYVKVLGKGATVLASRSQNIEADNKKVTVTFVELSEVNTEDNTAITDKTVDLSGDFTLTDPVDVDVGGVNAKVVTATRSGQPTIDIKICIFKASGELNFGGEKTSVVAGDVKFNLNISDYTFSTDPATTEFQLKVKVKGSAAKPTGPSGMAYGLGSGSTVKISKKVSKDDVYEDMRTTFPKLQDDTFLFRLPKFTKSVLYDPVISLGYSDVMFNVEGVYVKLKAMGGIITMARSQNIDADTNKVMLTLGEVRKINSSNAIVEKANFTDMAFTFDEVKDVNVTTPATMTKASITIMGGTLEVNFYLFKKEGVEKQDTEKTEVKKGDAKMEIKLIAYNLGLGNTLEIAMEIKGPDATPSLITGDDTGTDGKAYNLGKKSKVFLSKMVKIYKDFKNITANYPKLEQKTGAAFVFRFPNFDGNSLIYDPIIRVGNVTTSDDKPGTGSAAIQMINILLLLFSLLVSKMFY